MKKEVTLNPLEEIKSILRSNGYGDNLRLGHITYDQGVNEDYEYQIIRESTHDGTLFFTQNLIFESLLNLMNKQSYCKKTIQDEDLTKVKDMNYTIGDIKLESEFGVKTKFGSGVREVVTIPVKVEYVFH